MWTDPIVEEIREIKKSIAAEFNYDLEALYRSLIEEQEASGRTFVSFPPRPVTDQPLLQELKSTDDSKDDEALRKNERPAGKTPAA